MKLSFIICVSKRTIVLFHDCDIFLKSFFFFPGYILVGFLSEVSGRYFIDMFYKRISQLKSKKMKKIISAHERKECAFLFS